MISSYEQTEAYLESLIPDPQEKRKGNMRLERITHLLRLLGNPQEKFKSIHVGGTSGKGSVCFYLSSLLIEAGYRVGLHISPYLQVATERIQINSKFISEKEFAKLVDEIQPFVEQVDREGEYGKPSHFEVLVALSFWHFAQKRVDIAIIEVGLGGSMDATNVLKPLLAVITNVDLDHTEILGNTVEEIAKDKSGIIKEGIEVVTGAVQPSVVRILQEKCAQKNARLTRVVFDKKGTYKEHDALLARTALEKLKKYGFKAGNHKREAESCFPGRGEVVSQNPLIILDGAHNPAKMRALVDMLKKNYPKQKFVSIVAIKEKKDSKEMIRALWEVTDHFVFTTFNVAGDNGAIKPQDPNELGVILKGISASASFEVKETIDEFPKAATLITGSLYFVGQMRSRWYPWKKVLKQRAWYPHA